MVDEPKNPAHSPAIFRLKARQTFPVLALASGFFLLAGGLNAQTTASGGAKPGASSSTDDWSSKYEVAIFGGGSFYKLRQSNNPAPYKLVNGGIVGASFTWNFHRYVGLEASVSPYGTQNLRFQTFRDQDYVFPAHRFEVAVNPVVYLAPPTSRIRPFLTAGAALEWYRPSDEAKSRATSQVFRYLNATSLDSKVEPAFIYGGGVKASVNRWLGLRADFRGSVVKSPHFGLATFSTGPGSIFIPSGGTQLGFTATGGVIFKFGHEKEVVAAAIKPIAAPETAVITLNAPAMQTIDAGCPGSLTQPIALAVTASIRPASHQVVYQWTVNGSNAGTNSPNFSFDIPQQPGSYKVSVTVSDDVSGSRDRTPASPQSADLLTLTVKAPTAPRISGSANPTDLLLQNPGERKTSALSINAQAGDCGGDVVVKCTAPEGTLNGSPTPNEFDASTVSFGADRANEQSKTITISCTATDSKSGLTASTNIPVTVRLEARRTAIRFDDIDFPANNSRVNNCAKRILLEELYPQLTQHPDWDVLLVGHEAKGEGRGKRGAALDRERVLNTAATLSAGTDTCPRLEIGRIKVAFAKADQTSPTKPSFCGTSTRNKSNERRGQEVSGDDPNSQYRRVEIYLIPRGVPMPEIGSVKVEDAPASAIRAKGCPK